MAAVAAVLVTGCLLAAVAGCGVSSPGQRRTRDAGPHRTTGLVRPGEAGTLASSVLHPWRRLWESVRVVPDPLHPASDEPVRCGLSVGVVGGAAVARRPLLVVVGASVAAGQGAPHRWQAWPYQVADALGWRAVVVGVPGAGYQNTGWHGAGPIGRELDAVALRRLHPAVVVVQAGHDDIGRSTATEWTRVAAVVDRVRRAAPHAHLVLLTVFRGRAPLSSASATDRSIVDAARLVDPAVSVMNPLTGHWGYPTVADHLHPDLAGERWIADRVVRRLVDLGVQPAGSSAARPGTPADATLTLSSPCGDRHALGRHAA